MRKVIGSAALVLLVTAVSFGHDGPHDTSELLPEIELSQIVTLTVLVISLAVYMVGTVRLWRRAGRGRGIGPSAAGSFLAGWTSLLIALVGPFHRLSEMLFSAHMTQHEILMLVAAPLMIMGRPQIAAVWSLPLRWRQSVGAVTNNAGFERAWRLVSASFAAFLIHTAALWIWHIPVLFDATLESGAVHALQHASFFGTALLFWWAIINSALEWKSSFVGVLFLFLTSLHSGVLGALLTFTREVWYPAYQHSTAAYGLSPVEDQQLGGLIMWVPAGLVYIGAGLVMFARMLSQTERRAIAIDRRLFAGEMMDL